MQILQGKFQKEWEELQCWEQRGFQNGPRSGQGAKDPGTWLVTYST